MLLYNKRITADGLVVWLPSGYLENYPGYQWQSYGGQCLQGF